MDQIGIGRQPTKHAAKVTVPNIKVEVSMADYDAWAEAAKKWFVDGYHEEKDEMSGAIVFLSPDMKTEIDAARLLVWRACWMGANKKPFLNGEGSMSKLKAGEVAVRVTEEAIQILGGYGYTKEFPAERYYRDAKVTEIYEGTSEIQKMVIADWILREN